MPRPSSDGTEAAGAQQYDVRVTALATPSITSVSLYRDNSSEYARASDAISSAAAGANGLRTKANSALAADAVFDQAAALSDKIIVGYNGKTTGITVTGSTTLQGLIDGINNDAALKGKIEATYDNSHRQAEHPCDRRLGHDGSVRHQRANGQRNGATTTARFGFGLGNFGANATDITAVNGAGAATPVQTIESFRLGASAGNLAKLEQDFNKVRGQIDALADDAGYRGTNLLKGDTLLTVFNQDRTTSLTCTGASSPPTVSA